MVKQNIPNLFFNFLQMFRELFENPFLRGTRQAEADILAGKFVIKTYGKPVKWRRIYAELLKTNYNIVLESVSDEMVGDRKREEIRGYNSISKVAINKKHGRKTLEAVVEKAQELSEKEAKTQ